MSPEYIELDIRYNDTSIVLAFGMVIFTLRGTMVPSLTKEQPENYYHSKESERGWHARASECILRIIIYYSRILVLKYVGTHAKSSHT